MSTKGTGAPETTDLRCSGHCCKSFSVDVVYANGGLEACRAKHAAGDPAWASEEHRVVLDMLIELGEGTANPTAPDEEGDFGMFYGCKHHDENSGDCRIYERRPAMCREYPYRGISCKYKSCTFRRAPEEPVTIRKDTDQPTEAA